MRVCVGVWVGVCVCVCYLAAVTGASRHILSAHTLTCCDVTNTGGRAVDITATVCKNKPRPLSVMSHIAPPPSSLSDRTEGIGTHLCSPWR